MHGVNRTSTRVAWVLIFVVVWGVGLPAVPGPLFAQSTPGGRTLGDPAVGEPAVEERFALHLFTADPGEAGAFERVSAAGDIAGDERRALFGGRSLRFTTDGDGSNVHAAVRGLEPIDIRDRALEIWLRVENLSDLGELRLYLASTDDFSDRVVYMIDRDRSQLVEGAWLRVTLPPGEGRPWGNPDRGRITAIQVWANDRGTGPVRVWFDGLSLVERPSMPEVDGGPRVDETGIVGEDRSVDNTGAVVFTFDDGWEDQLTQAAPVMAPYGFPATAYVIPELIGTEGYLSMEQLRRLETDYGWTVGAHALTPLTVGSREERVRRLDRLQRWFSENGFVSPADQVDLAYPNGMFDAEMLALVAPRFRSGRTIVEFGETLPPGDPFRLRVYNVVRGVEVDEVRAAAVRARDNGELLILVFHRVDEDLVAETVINPDTFSRIVAAIDAVDVPVVPLATVIPEDAPRGFVLDGTPPPTVAWAMDLRIDGESTDDREGEADGGARAAPVAPGAAPSADVVRAPIGAADDPPGPARPVDQSLGESGEVSLSFGFDWKFVAGVGEGDRSTYYSQLDELFLSLSRPVGTFATLSAVGGVRPVTFDDLSTGQIAGDDLYLDSIVLTDRLGSRLFPASRVTLDVEAGYRDYYPRNKWEQVTQWSVVESPFAQDLTPKSLWVGAHTSWRGLFAVAAFSPDFIGVSTESGNRDLTTNPGDGVPQFFFDVGREAADPWGATLVETAVAVGGDAVKWVAMARHQTDGGPWRIATSLGWKSAWGRTYETYPMWEPHAHGAFTVSGGVSPSWTAPTGVVARLGVAAAIDGEVAGGVDQGRLGVDVRVSRDWWSVFAGVATRDAGNWRFGRNDQRTAGWEAGAALQSGGVSYLIGYTTAGFSMRSGLYGNRFDEGGGDGVFVRIKNSM